MHPVVKARQPLGLFLDIMDFKCVAIDGKATKDTEDFYIRFDSHGRVFRKSKDTNGLWERVPEEEIAKWISECKARERRGSVS